jgi:hypothetical protein
MNEQAKYQVSFPGQFHESQISVGDHNALEQRIGTAARERLGPRELETLARELGRVRELAAAQSGPLTRDEALSRVDELEAATIGADQPEPGRLARVYRWFVENAPDVAESVSSLLLGPLVGKLVGAGSGAIAAALGADEKPS